jgi:TolB-like protein/Tfp pilus assembly protein PilF/class 3 adenylate cyclase
MPSQSSDVKLEIGHVLFIDIVGYSKLLINEQSERIQRLKEIVRGTEQVRLAEAEGKLLRLPTGDGGALVFRNNPEAPVLCALEISKELKKHPELRVRMGIHSGPVNEISDLNEQANIAGAGINIAQRVMDCGDAGHILLSKRVADDLEQYSQWRSQLHDLGECEVKHGMRLHVVNLYRDELGNPNLPDKFRSAAQTSQARRKLSFVGIIAVVLLIGLAIVAMIFAPAILRSREKGQKNNPASANETSVVAIPEKSIAVLPFENRSEDKANAYFADGIQDEILTRLSKIADLKVISRTSTQHYKSAPENLREIASQLGVAHIVEGSVQKSGDTVRVNVQLIKAANDSHLWADTFDRKLTDVFAVESEIAKSIADTLKAKLTGSEEHAISARPTENTEAHQFYLKGRYFWNKRTGPDLQTAIDYFKQAIEQDSNYALAYAGLADSYVLLPYFGAGTLQQSIPPAKAAAQKALELDPTLAEPHSTLGEILFYDFDFSQSKKEFERAIALDPNDATAHQWFGNGPLIVTGEFDRAIAEGKRAVELDPLSLVINTDLAVSYTMARRYSEVIEQFNKILAMDPRFYYARWTFGLALQCNGQLPEAIAQYKKAAELTDDPLVLAWLAQGYAKAGQRDEALKLLAQMEELATKRYVGAWSFAIVHLALGEKGKAIDELERAIRERSDPFVTFIKVSPLFDPLRGDPRFQALLAKAFSPGKK